MDLRQSKTSIPGECLVTAGNGWRALEVVCDSGPTDRPFEEAHGDLSVSAVLDGVFTYRSGQGRAVMTPGSLLLGNRGGAYCCSHDVCRGDCCLSFQFSAELVEETASDVGGLRHASFCRPRLPPATATARHLHAARCLSDRGLSPFSAETLAIELLGLALSTEGRDDVAVTAHDERRIAGVLDYMHAHYDEQLGLAELARLVGLGRHQFLRVFRRVVGLPPHAYIVAYRLSRAAAALDDSSDKVIEVALDSGFSDLSEFTRRFRAVYGHPPARFRRRLD